MSFSIFFITNSISQYCIYIHFQTSNDGNVTVSELVFVPGPEDNEKSITCSIEYQESEGATIRLKDSHVLDIKRKFAPGEHGPPCDPLHRKYNSITCILVYVSVTFIYALHRCAGDITVAWGATRLAESDGGIGRVPGV